MTLAAEFLGVNHKWLAGERAPMLLDKKSDANVVFNNDEISKIPVLDYVQAGLFNSVGYDGVNPIGETYTTYKSAKKKVYLVLPFRVTVCCQTLNQVIF